MFTHFAKADEKDKTYTLQQHEKFMWMKAEMEKNLEKKRNAPVSRIANPVLISTLLANDTIVAPSKPKFTAPLWGKERPQFKLELPATTNDSSARRPELPAIATDTLALPDSTATDRPDSLSVQPRK